MNTPSSLLACFRALPTFALLLVLACLPRLQAQADAVPALLDDFSDPKNTPSGIARIVVDDAAVGGSSHLTHTTSDGVLVVNGGIKPARGQPGWAGLVLLLSSDGTAVDLSGFQGIRLRVHVRQGSLSISANSTEVDNFDYHARLLPRSHTGPQEVHIPFADMKRMWSEPTPLRPETIASISLAAVGMQSGDFGFDLDEIGFY